MMLWKGWELLILRRWKVEIRASANVGPYTDML